MRQEDRIAHLEQENATLRAELAAVYARLKRLEQRLAKDSHKSSQPPSRDGVERQRRGQQTTPLTISARVLQDALGGGSVKGDFAELADKDAALTLHILGSVLRTIDRTTQQWDVRITPLAIYSPMLVRQNVYERVLQGREATAWAQAGCCATVFRRLETTRFVPLRPGANVLINASCTIGRVAHSPALPCPTPPPCGGRPLLPDDSASRAVRIG